MYACMQDGLHDEADEQSGVGESNLQGGEVFEMVSDERVAEPLHLLLVALTVTLTYWNTNRQTGC